MRGSVVANVTDMCNGICSASCRTCIAGPCMAPYCQLMCVAYVAGLVVACVAGLYGSRCYWPMWWPVLLACVVAHVIGPCGGLCYWPVWRPVLLAHVAACVTGPCGGLCCWPMWRPVLPAQWWLVSLARVAACVTGLRGGLCFLARVVALRLSCLCPEVWSYDVLCIYPYPSFSSSISVMDTLACTAGHAPKSVNCM